MLKKENAKYRRKILACTLAVSTITGSIIMTSGSSYASAVTSIEEIKNNQVGVCGVFTDNWGADSDIPMNDDDGDGIWEAKIEFDVKEEYITDWSCDGEPTKEGSGIQFKIRLNNDWSDCWGNYDNKNGAWNSQYNYGIPASEVNVGDHVSFTAYLDTNRNDPLAIAAGEVGADDPAEFIFLAGGVKDLEVTHPQTGYVYEKNEDGLTLTGYVGSDTVINIPSEIDGEPVTELYRTFCSDYGGIDSENITEINIPKGIKRITSAFINCKSLTDITIPEGVTSINVLAFAGCSGLTSIDLPDSIESTDGDSYYGCTGLKKINVSDSNKNYSSQDGVLFNKDKTELISYPGGKSGKYVIPDTVKVIYFNTFMKISAFSGCIGLSDLTIPDSITLIREQTFSGCTELKNIIFPDSMEYIEPYALEDTAWFDSQPNGLIYAGNIAYKYKGVMPNDTSITLKPGTLSISDYAFWSPARISEPEPTEGDCSGLVSISIPVGVKSIGAHAFSGCINLKSITIPDSVKQIGENAIGYDYNDLGNPPYENRYDDITIHGYIGSAAETYAQENGITFVALDSEIVTDTPTKLIDDESKITVEGLIPYGTALKVNPLTVDKTKDPDVIASYDISLINGENAAIQPDGKIEISIPCDTEDCKVMWVKDDGTKTDMNAEYINGYYVFTTDHLSVYQIVKNTGKSSEVSDDKTEVSNDKPATDTEISSGNNDVSTGTDNPTDNLPQTGETGILFIPMVLVFCASIVIISVFRKRKHQ